LSSIICCELLLVDASYLQSRVGDASTNVQRDFVGKEIASFWKAKLVYTRSAFALSTHRGQALLAERKQSPIQALMNNTASIQLGRSADCLLNGWSSR